MTYIIISFILFVLYALLMVVYRIGWNGQEEINLPENFIPTVKITVVIPARNEADNIEACIQSILNNQYSPSLLEIIIADDFSTDDTAIIAGNLLEQHKAGFVLSLSQHISSAERLNSYKKKALELAIAAASGELIVTTDADCIVPEKWLQHLAYAFQQNDAQFIAAPVSFTPAVDGGLLLYFFQSLDFMTMQGITAASARLKLGNMCNGANLAFSKKAFNEVGGYKGIDHIASGDDMMLMYKISKKYPTQLVYLKQRAAIVNTPVQPTWRSFLNQRIRWSSKADKYDDKKLTWILALVYFFNLNFPVLIIASLFDGRYFFVAWSLIVGKTLVELIFLHPVAKFYGKQQELMYFPLLQPLHILYVISAGFLGKFGTYQWKGRTVK